MTLAQLFIALLGVPAVALAQSEHESRRRWASIFGLAGQPFWFYAAVDGEQWGIFLLSVLYTLVWAKGFHAHWVKKGATYAKG